MAGWFEMTRFTPIATVPAAPGELSVIWPVYVPGPKLPPFAVTVRVAGVVALVGVTVNQLDPWLTETVEAKVTAPPTLVTEMVCGLGAGPPLACEKVSELCETCSVAVGVTINVTAILCGL